MSLVLVCFAAFLLLAVLGRKEKDAPTDDVACGVPLVSATGVTVYADGQLLLDGSIAPQHLLEGLVEAKRIVTVMKRQGRGQARTGQPDHRALVLEGILVRLGLAIRTVQTVIGHQASEDAA